MTLTPDFSAYLAGGFMQTQWQTLASIKWGIIQDKPTTVSFERNRSLVPDQVVRIEFENTFLTDDSELGTTAMRRGTIHGVKGHPEIDDTDIKEWDVFWLNDVEYTVVFVNQTLVGEIQADFEAR